MREGNAQPARRTSRWALALIVLLVLGLAGCIGGAALLENFGAGFYRGHDAEHAPGASLALVSQGNIYVQYSSPSVSANAGLNHFTYTSLAVFSAESGKLLWQASDVGRPLIADATTIYTPDMAGTALVARDAQSGSVRWRVSEPLVPDAVVDGILYTHAPESSSGKDAFVALQASTGGRLWTEQVPGFSYKVQLEVAQGMAFFLSDNRLMVFQVTNGKLLWSMALGEGGGSAFTIANGVLYLSEGNSKTLLALQPGTGKLHWLFQVPRMLSSSPPIVTPDGILVVNAVDELYGLRASDGKQLWSFPGTSTGEFATGPQAILTAGGVLYVPSSAGLFALQARNGKQVWHFDPGEFTYVSSLDLDASSGMIYATITPSGPRYLAVLHTNGQLIKRINLQASGDTHISGGALYQATPGGWTLDNANTYYDTQFDLTATQLSDAKALWSAHVQY